MQNKYASSCPPTGYDYDERAEIIPLVVQEVKLTCIWQ